MTPRSPLRRRFPARAALALAVAACLLGTPDAGAADLKELEAQLGSRDVLDRLAAVAELSGESGPVVSAMLVSALRDADWEVVEQAAVALGKVGGDDALGELVKLTVDGPVRRVRLAAAEALVALDAAGGATALGKRVSGKAAEHAAEGLAVIVSGAPSARAAAEAGIEKGLRSPEEVVKRAAARGLGALAVDDRPSMLARLLADEDVAIVAAATDGVRAAPEIAYLEPLLGLLQNENVLDVVERRVRAAIRDVVATATPGEEATKAAQPVADRLAGAAKPAVAARLSRVIGWLARDPVQPGMTESQVAAAEKEERLVDPKWAVDVLAKVLDHKDPAPRAAAAHALAGIRTDAAIDLAAASASADQDARVRLHALRAVTSNRSVEHDGTRTLALSRLEYDEDPRVREHAAVALGRKGVPDVLPGLETALRDKDWSVAVCAAVSLGKTEDVNALEALGLLLTKSKDWRLRGAAAVGLGHLRDKQAVPYLIAALDAKDTAVARSAYEFLRRLTDQEIAARSSAWKEWWVANGPDYVFIDHEEEARKAKKFGYAPDTAGVYQGQDVIVLQSRGDHIEQLLEVLDIEHRITRGGSVSKSELHPFAVFVSNCTGEINDKDVEQLEWFVRVGGYLFCSCWALHHTAELVYPGMVRKLPTKQEVVDYNIESEACPTDSPFIEGVFDGVTRPIYILYGSHLIEVLDPEGVEVLIDSPVCATRYGGGNLAAWFDAGHGVILDSANHFDLQGLEKAEGLKSVDDRKAFAMDHMGLDYTDLRAISDKVWKSTNKAAKEARDLSAFRLITNFVRQKRRQQQ